jgi:hypothetical protein
VIASEDRHDGGPADPSPPARGPRRRLKTWLAAASAVMVFGIALIVWLAVTPGQPGTGPAKPPDRASFGPYAAAAPPPFLLDLNADGPGSDLSVLSASTGRLIVTLAPPRTGLFYRDTAATSDGRTFIVAAEARTGGCDTWLYRLRLTAQGREAALTPLPVPEISGQILPTNDLSVSADGRTVAYSATPCTGGPVSTANGMVTPNGHHPSGAVGVINLLTGKVSVWHLTSESAWSLSLSANGQMLGFVNTVIYGGDGTVRSLPANAPPGSIAQRAHLVLRAGLNVDVNGSVAMNPNGRVMLACSETSHTATLAAYDVASGRLLGVLHAWRHVNVAPCEVSVTPSGRYVLVYNLSFTGIGTRIDLATGRLTDLVSSPGHQSQPLGVSW